MTELKLYNTLTRKKEVFVPADDKNVRLYVCGPTVYDHAHIGNARPVIVFDVLYRLLRHLYGADHVTYVRNITDLDDKINARAARDFPNTPLNEAIAKVTGPTTAQFHKDVAALGCLQPTHEPRATGHIPGMVAMIQTLIDKNHAYVATGKEGREVLFSVASMPDYGQLSKRNLDDQQAGARVAVEPHKKNPADFVLWKESTGDEPGWDGDFRFGGKTVSIRGRPGWHIECSVMSEAHLGQTFDIHGGGLDLIFPHHENEIAQSRCAHGTPMMAKYWMHNGFLQVEGRKMSKSEGNFVTIHELLETEKFGGRKWPGEVLRLAMLMTHYREPVDFSVRRLEEAENILVDWATIIIDELGDELGTFNRPVVPSAGLVQALSDDLSLSEALNILRLEASSARDVPSMALQLLYDCEFLGVFRRHLVGLHTKEFGGFDITPEKMVAAYDPYQRYRIERLNGDGTVLFRFIEEVNKLGLEATEKSHGELHFRSLNNDDSDISIQIKSRLAFLASKNFAEADKIRAGLLAQGIQLMDYKDPATGERKTKWEIKR